MEAVVVVLVLSVEVEYCVKVGTVMVVNRNDVAAKFVAVVVVT